MRLSGNWRLRHQRYSMRGEVCDKCGARIFPPRDVCPECSQPAATPYTFKGKGEVYSFATVYDSPQGFEEFAPYPVALVKLEEGPLVAAQLTDIDPEDVEIGMPVEMVTRKLYEEGEEGMIVYGYKFRPELKEAQDHL